METTALSTFQHEKFGEIRTMKDEKGEPWFISQEITKALDYGNNAEAVRTNVDKEDIAKIYIPELSNINLNQMHVEYITLLKDL
jgi:prophage antirepressor-like protein